MKYLLHTRLGVSYSVYKKNGRDIIGGYILRIGNTEFYLPKIKELSKKSIHKLMKSLRVNFVVIDDSIKSEGIRPKTIKKLLESAVQEEEKRIRESKETQNL